MAVSISEIRHDVTSLRRAFCKLTFSGTYTTGGETPSPTVLKALGFSKILMAHFMQFDVVAAGGLIATYDVASGKLFLRETAGTVDLPFKELSSGASLTNVVFLAEFVGEGNN